MSASTVAVPGAIGAVSALAVQRLANRAQSADSRANRRMQKRAELREAESFADPASVHRSNRADSGGSRGERNTLLHRMWFRQRALAVVTSDELDAASLTLTVTMRNMMFANVPEDQDMWEYLDGPRTGFLRSAHDALYDED